MVTGPADLCRDLYAVHVQPALPRPAAPPQTNITCQTRRPSGWRNNRPMGAGAFDLLHFLSVIANSLPHRYPLFLFLLLPDMCNWIPEKPLVDGFQPVEYIHTYIHTYSNGHKRRGRVALSLVMAKQQLPTAVDAVVAAQTEAGSARVRAISIPLRRRRRGRRKQRWAQLVVSNPERLSLVGNDESGTLFLHSAG